MRITTFFFFFASLFLSGCVPCQVIRGGEDDPHPADSCAAVSFIEISNTLAIDEENLPQKPEKEKKIQHMHHEGIH